MDTITTDVVSRESEAQTESFEYIRGRYHVPAEKGARVLYKGRPGVITGARGPHVRVRLDGESYVGIYHPTWEMVYVGA